MNQPLAVLFAGPPGCSKSPVAYHLSWNLGLPVFSNDAIRTEVHEAVGPELDIKEFEHRRAERLAKLLESRRPFIYDASVDRRWEELTAQLKENGYRWALISFNLSPEFLAELAGRKGYAAPRELVERWQKDHDEFWRRFGGQADLVIDDDNFGRRLNVALDTVNLLGSL